MKCWNSLKNYAHKKNSFHVFLNAKQLIIDSKIFIYLKIIFISIGLAFLQKKCQFLQANIFKVEIFFLHLAFRHQKITKLDILLLIRKIEK